jgi:hypothetical protein
LFVPAVRIHLLHLPAVWAYPANRNEHTVYPFVKPVPVHLLRKPAAGAGFLCRDHGTSGHDSDAIEQDQDEDYDDVSGTGHFASPVSQKQNVS